MPPIACNPPAEAAALYRRGLASEAIACLEAAAQRSPERPQLWINLALLQFRAGRFDAAERAARTAVTLAPRDPDALTNLALVFAVHQRYALAEAAIGRALAAAPDHGPALAGRGFIAERQAKYAEAGVAYAAAASRCPEYAEARLNHAFSLLRAGDFAAGWEAYEWRWRTEAFAPSRRRLPMPEWDGGPLDNRSIFVWHEQGLGDTIQFARYLPLLVERGARVVAAVQTPLIRLLRASMPMIEIVDREAPVAELDMHAPMLSLPRGFGTTLRDIPARMPYLRAADSEAFANDSKGFKVGLVWAGAAENPNDRFRSIAVRDLAPILAVRGATFYSLQVGANSSVLRAVADRPPIADLTPRLIDFADTADAVAALDLIIAVDTAVAHLAGALGKPVWTLIATPADWRWMIAGDDSPWYPTMRLFRQPRPGDWKTPIARIAAALAGRTGG
ncbi:MAG TPA: tetratricopeptide repeat protein [Alphaproteobacteria bacterium]|nr:tetratricopeptide repeat protein [Alphaproteobacteria bacterium]